MARVSEAAKLYVPADRVWDVVGDFEAIDRWHPAVLGSESESQGNGTTRRLDIGEGARLVETLEAYDAAGMAYRYTLREGPLPIAAMTAELRVKPDDANSCTVEWSAELEPEGEAEEGAAIAAVRDHFRRGLEHLRFTLAG